MTMLTVKQPAHYGYKSVHDLPTPPSTSRPSPPLIYQETVQKPLSTIPRSHSPSSQPMSAHHRGLPLPAAMTLPPQPPPSAAIPPSSHPPGPPPLGPVLTTPHSHALGQLPGPPPQWQGAEDSMRSWLAAKTEEERRKQEEEKTRQETLRLEQRRIECEMLRTSLDRGIPPYMVPVVFAGMGGGILPQAALEWAQHSFSQTQGHPQLLAPQSSVSPEHRRDSQPHTYSGYSGVPSTPGSAPAQPGGGYITYPTSPTRGQRPSGPVGGNASRPLGPGTNPSGIGAASSQSGTGGQPPVQTHHLQQQQQQQQQQHEAQANAGIFFHHWQPPASQASGSSTQPATPSGSSKTKRKQDSL
jgi:hypothetical protein